MRRASGLLVALRHDLRRTMETVYDRLVRGAVDIHCHVDVEFSLTHFRKAMPEWEWLPRAEAAGVRAVVLKSHLWPTAPTIPYIEQLYQGDVKVYGSITLNPTTGGLDPYALETAALLGARVVWLPTWGSRNDYGQGFGQIMKPAFEHFDDERLATMTLINEAGSLTEAAHEILRLAKEYDLVLSSGHGSADEVLALAEEARAIGFEKLVWGHPWSGPGMVPAELVRKAADLGALIEFCWFTVSPGRRNPADVVALIKELGASRVLLTSDFFGGNASSPSDLLRMFLGTLYDAGLSEDDVHKAVSENPARLIGL